MKKQFLVFIFCFLFTALPLYSYPVISILNLTEYDLKVGSYCENKESLTATNEGTLVPNGRNTFKVPQDLDHFWVSITTFDGKRVTKKIKPPFNFPIAKIKLIQGCLQIATEEEDHRE